MVTKIRCSLIVPSGNEFQHFDKYSWDSQERPRRLDVMVDASYQGANIFTGEDGAIGAARAGTETFRGGPSWFDFT